MAHMDGNYRMELRGDAIMPTGYTYFIENGEITTGKEFLKKCIRAFGCCINQREESLNTPLETKIKSDDYYEKRYYEAVEKYEKIKKMTLEERIMNARRDRVNRTKELEKYLDDQKKLRNKYMNIRNEVEQWNPPTAEHQGIKSFALEQIDISMPSEEDLIRIQEDIARNRNMEDSSVIKDVIALIEGCVKDIEYYSNKMREEENRVDGRNEFLDLFLKSLEEE